MGAGREDSPDRPVLPMDDLMRLLDVVPERCTALVLLATFAGLRFGELAALRRNEIDLVRLSSGGALDGRDERRPLDQR